MLRLSDRCLSDGLNIDLKRRILSLGMRRISLTPTEMDMVCYLARQEGRPVSLEEISVALWGSRSEKARSVARKYVAFLRKKLAVVSLDGNALIFERQRGYRIAAIQIVDFATLDGLQA